MQCAYLVVELFNWLQTKWATDTFLPYLIFHYNFLQKSGNITEDLQVFHYHIAANVSNKKMPETHAEQMHFTKQNPGQCINLITEILHRLANNSRIRFQKQKQKNKKTKHTCFKSGFISWELCTMNAWEVILPQQPIKNLLLVPLACQTYFNLDRTALPID